MTRRSFAAFASAALFAFATGANAQDAPRPPSPRLIRVITFDGGWNLPLWAAQRQGFFEANGVTVQVGYTPSSGFLVASLFDGRYDVALALIDNRVAYEEGHPVGTAGPTAIACLPSVRRAVGRARSSAAALRAPVAESRDRFRAAGRRTARAPVHGCCRGRAPRRRPLE
jgi:hypothetical protein